MTITPSNPLTIRIHNNAYARFHQLFCKYSRLPSFEYVRDDNTLCMFRYGDTHSDMIYIHYDDWVDFHNATDIPIPAPGEVVEMFPN